MQTIEQTGDGSITIRNTGSGVTYHSVHGAISESMHVFINAGLDFLAKTKTSISILELGFGTGLNALLTYRYSVEKSLSICYEAFELFPLKLELVEQLNYCSLDNLKSCTSVFNEMHKADWGRVRVFGKNFELKKRNEDIIEAELNNNFDLIYFDAFDPVHQPQLWTESVFRKIYNASNEHAVLVTYSSKGDVRRALTAAGFTVEKLKGAPGKREMLRALK
ncbi:tRNA (5-methylaminomethyl-2-thiouridine)(34)-methyltransferase MnmD [Pollutibacter soli]|uniref:tRNA (5-methylaminomethyl-2-thiouridine)(34)-methyltransferase MnmD n=1 Tax=Pollutibacter soli TaxID=3034157 RepID=UPI0030136654